MRVARALGRPARLLRMARRDHWTRRARPVNISLGFFLIFLSLLLERKSTQTSNLFIFFFQLSPPKNRSGVCTSTGTRSRLTPCLECVAAKLTCHSPTAAAFSCNLVMSCPRTDTSLSPPPFFQVYWARHWSCVERWADILLPPLLVRVRTSLAEAVEGSRRRASLLRLLVTQNHCCASARRRRWRAPAATRTCASAATPPSERLTATFARRAESQPR